MSDDTPNGLKTPAELLQAYRFHLSEMMRAVAPAFVSELIANNGKLETAEHFAERLQVMAKNCRITAQVLLIQAHSAMPPGAEPAPVPKSKVIV